MYVEAPAKLELDTKGGKFNFDAQLYALFFDIIILQNKVHKQLKYYNTPI